ncbi:AMP-binding protein [Streptomyces lushanensis]|uniref:AMP-binding protein n=1 Tax=Streptomyces lushanensis TaxID=1434255 RepID=UPI00082EE13E|nr:AMP-binding protein [Streptomyces lushanensis]
MKNDRTYGEVIHERALTAPAREALVLVAEDGTDTPAGRLTYGELDGRAAALAGWLREHGPAGQRVLVAQPSPRLFAVGLLACMYAGAVAVPVAVPGASRYDAERVLGIVRDASAGVVLTDAVTAPDLSLLLARHGHDRVSCLAVESVPDGSGIRAPTADADGPALLQYTSGSAREPRGTVLTHRNLLAGQRAVALALGTRPGDRIGGWLPVHHGMGLVTHLLHPLWLGGTGVLMSRNVFARRPAAWPEAVSAHRIRVSGGPGSAYERCARQVGDREPAGLDLSGWETAFSTPGPVRPEALRAFADRFAPAGFRRDALRTCYGPAEVPVVVSGSGSGAEAVDRTVDAAGLERHGLRRPVPGRPTRTLADRGIPAGAELRIVDPVTREVLPDGRTGEIWVRGAAVAHGYWNRPRESAEVFDARTAAGDGRGFLRTGDLGAMSDGRLYVTGRIEDTVVLADRSLSPGDLEHAVRQVSDLFGAGAAFGVGAQREHVVVILELRGNGYYGVDLPALVSAVRERLVAEFQLSPAAVFLVRSGTVRRGAGGTVGRGELRRLLLGGELKAIHEVVGHDVRELIGTGEA